MDAGESRQRVVSILVVDDEPDLRFVLRRIFQGAGYQVTEAGHGGAALDAVAAALPDLVVTDMMMPVMGGAELIRRLRSGPATASIPIMAVSGDPHLADGADVIVPKPFLKRDVLAGVDRLLHAEEARTP
jgi:CheY-like chemotaxis protein